MVPALSRLGLVIVTSAVGTLIVVRPELDPLGATLLVVAGFIGWMFVVLGADTALRGRSVAVAIGVLLALAVVVAPRGSHDLWGYVAYGRIVSMHHANPYVTTPGHFSHDHLLHLMGRGYHHTRSPYGPAFTAISAIGTAFAGPSALADRLVFQGLAALAIGLALVVLWRRTRSPAALAWVGLNPLVLTSVVNDGHNDALLALAILVGVILATDKRPVASGFVLALGALVKLPGLLALGGVCLWTLRRRDVRAACTTAGVGIGVVALGYLPVAPSALRALGDTGQLVSRMSVWTPVREALRGAGHADLVLLLPTLGLVVVAALASFLAWAWSSDRDPGTSAAGSTAGFTLAGSYVLPWYATWGLPVLATRRSSSLAWLVAVQGAFLLAIYQLPDHASAATNGLMLHVLLADVVPTVLVVVAIGLGLRHARRRRGARRVLTTASDLETMSANPRLARSPAGRVLSSS